MQQLTIDIFIRFFFFILKKHYFVLLLFSYVLECLNVANTFGAVKSNCQQISEDQIY